MKFVFMTNADSSSGTGHLMRCLALAQEIKQRGYKVSIITNCSFETINQRILKESFPIYFIDDFFNWGEIIKILQIEEPEWLILDGYNFRTEYQKNIKDSGYKLLVIDDNAHLEYYYSDIILNQNFEAETLLYNIEPYTKLLLGTKYVLLRKEFFTGTERKREFPEVGEKIVVTMGGADNENFTLKIIKALNLIEQPLNIKIIIGAANTNYDSVRYELKKAIHAAEILVAVNNMASILSWADVVISAGGITVWEIAFVGVPSILCIVAKNQERTVRSLVKNGYFLSPGWLKKTSQYELKELIENLVFNKNLRRILSEKALTLVDGKGAERVINAIIKMPLKILFLGGNMSRQLADWLSAQGEILLYTEEKIDIEIAKKFNPDLIISYNYRYILKQEILNIPKKGPINLHISYLPWNRGAHPNVWSFIDNTPKGVSIHYIDEGIDTGDILFQKEILIDENKETLKSSYEILHKEIQNLFKTHWLDIKAGKLQPKKQIGSGTIHYRKDANIFKKIIELRGWDIPINVFKKEIQKLNILTFKYGT